MIGFNYLGNMGHLGNQMFQYAAVKGIATHKGYDWCIAPKENAGKNYPLGLLSEIYSCFNLNSCKHYSYVDGGAVAERSFSFDKDLFEKCPDNVTLYGYFQSEKYFKHIEDELRDDFTFKPEIVKECNEIVGTVFEDIETAVSLHIRRGDYTTNPNHPIQPLDWYENAISNFDSKCEVVVFSDDPKWCMEQEIFSDDRFIVSNGNTPYHDLCLMSKIKNHIICNSSFSWWGAWLANSKNVVAPKNWFSGSCIDHDTSDLYCSGWKVV